MGNLARYHTADMPQLFDRILKNSIGMDDMFDSFMNIHEQNSNYPPYNLVQVNNVESRLEIALAGFKKDEVKVYTSLENYLSKASKKQRRQMQLLSIKDWPAGLSLGSGQSQMIPRSETYNSEMDYW